MEVDRLRKIQLCGLRILCEIDRICKKHNIKYFLAYGTLLGAIRHGGFIPWDDDIDIGMKVEEYNKFLKVCESELNPEFLLKRSDSKEALLYFISFSKVTMKELPIFVDIFPFYYLPENKLSRFYIETKLMLLHDIIYEHYGRKIENERHKIIGKIYHLGIIRLLERITYATVGEKYIIHSIRKIEYNMTTPTKQLRSLFYQNIESDLLETFIDRDFEEVKFPVPSKYEEILTAWYGDYMTPVKTHVHLTECPPLGKYEKYNSVSDVLEDVESVRN